MAAAASRDGHALAGRPPLALRAGVAQDIARVDARRSPPRHPKAPQQLLDALAKRRSPHGRGGPGWLDLQSQAFSRSYGSNLPTSLTYIYLWTRGFSPWRPDADWGTA